MNLLILPLGLLPVTINGWLLLGLLQRNKRVLFAAEQWVMGCVTGITFTMLITFAAHAFCGLPFNLFGMLGVQLATMLVLGLTYVFVPKDTSRPLPIASTPISRGLKILFGILGVWIIVKTLIPAVIFLTLTPTYLDDSLDNWNLRGKVFYYDQALTLAMPSEDPLASPLGVSSYPPTVPLMKTWLAVIARDWNDPLVNSLHIVWYIAALALLYFVLRRMTNRAWSTIGTFMLASMPLYLMHGINPYADAFVSVHVFLAVSLMFLGLYEADPAARMSLFRLGSVAAGLLTFTKNEGMIMYLPALLLILCIGLWYLWKTQRITIRDIVTTLLWYGVTIAVLALPWLIFKWMHGLTFGNAKPIGSLGIGWQKGILLTIFINMFFEGNWLLLFPELIALLVWQRRSAFGVYLPLTAFFLLVFIGQNLLFLFTSLAVEARMQTGLARGIVQLLPVIVLLTALLLANARESIEDSIKELASRVKSIGR